MILRVVLYPQAKKYLEKLPHLISQRIVSKIEAAALEPSRFLEHLASANVYKLRIGDYRALIDIDTQQGLLLVQKIEHRSKIYQH
jgi:mRNA interferase RelE/StbE